MNLNILQEFDQVLAFLTVSSAVKLISLIINGGKRPKKAEYVGEISDIIFYPVKSAKGIKLNEVECLQRGFKYPNKDVFDRNFVIVDEDGRSASASYIAKVSLITCTVTGDHITLDAVGMTPIQVPITTETDVTKARMAKVIREQAQGQDCGDDVAQWICKLFGKQGFRLLYGAEGLEKRQMNKQKDKWKKEAKDGDVITFQNAFPVMLASESSLAELNRRSKDTMVMERFRPNLVISGSKAFDEDNWRELWIGDMKFTQLKPCNRCPVTLVNPTNAVKNEDDEPLNTLRTFRLAKQHFGQSPLFGVNLVLDTQPDTLKVGDPVYILRGRIM